MKGRASPQEIEAAVWSLVAAADLQTLTPKAIRAKLRARLGDDRLARTDGELKGLVRDLIPAMIKRRERRDADAAAAAAAASAAVEPVRDAPPSRLQKRARAVPSSDSDSGAASGAAAGAGSDGGGARAGGGDAASGASEGGDDAPPPNKPGPTRGRPAKRKRAAAGRAEPQLARVLRVARQLGLRIPPRVLAAAGGEPEAVDACREFLRSKGARGDVLRMSGAAVREERARLEREKELRELDVCNIIASDDASGRRRPRRAGVQARAEVASRGEDDGPGEGGGAESGAAGGEDSSSSSGDSSGSEFEISQ
jgi:uncharacterized membrane protein YgcG